MSILFVFTSANRTLFGAQTGWFLPEAAHPYNILSPHFAIDFASSQGPDPPLHDGSVSAYSMEAQCFDFLQNETVKKKLENTKKLADIQVDDYLAIFYIGGHGPVMGLASDPMNASLASKFFQAGKIVSAVSHGPAALVGAVDAEGKSIFKGRSFTGFSNAEEEIMGTTTTVPFLLEAKIKSLGGQYEVAAKLFEARVVVDGNLITGQNPASAAPIAEAILKQLKA